MIGRDFNLFETPWASANPFAQVVNRAVAKKPQIELSKIPNAPLIATKDWKWELATTVPWTQGFGALGGGRIATEPEIEKINAFAEAIKTDNPEYSVLPPEKNKGLVEAFIQDNPEYSSIFQSKEPEQSFIGGLADKTKGSFMSGIRRIWEAGVWLAEGKYDVGEAGIRGAAGALESAFSPIAWALGQGIESFIPDRVKESVGGTLAPVIEKGSEMYSNLSPEAQRLVGNLWVAWEVGLNFLWVWAAGRVAWSEITKTAVKKTGKVLAKWATSTGRGVGKVWGAISTIPEYGVEVATGLSKEAQQVIKRAPSIYKKARTGEITRNTIFDETKSALDKRLDDLSELWRSYKDLRTGKVVWLSDDLRNAYTKSVQSVDLLDLPTADRNAIAEVKKYIDEIQGDLTDRQLLAMRKKIDSTISWDKGVGSEWQAVVRGIRAEIDNLAKSKIAGLAERDAKFAPEIKFLNTVKNSIYDAKGNVKDNAISAINNLTGKGKEFKIDRFEQILPWITQKIDALKAFEEVQGISGIKTGSILRQWGGLVAGTTAGWPVGALLGFVLTHPGIAARVLEAYGMTKSAISDILTKRASKSVNDQAIKIIKTAKLPEVERIIIKQKPTSIINLPKKDKIVKPNPSGLRREPITSKIGGIAKKLDMSKNKKGFINPWKIAEDLWATKADDSIKALMEEARKYGSAEEFMKWLEKQKKISYHGTNAKFDTFSLKNFWQTDEWFSGVGYYFSWEKSYAKEYGKIIKKAFLDIKRPYIYEDNMALWSVNPWKFRISLWLDENASASAVRKELVKQWYDWVIIKNEWKNIEEMVLNSSQIKTESQLKDMYNKAN